MRVTRAYLAGFGTSGSLLAGAALMFLLVSAFVAFHGWPQVDGQSAPVLVSVPRTSLGDGTKASRVLTASTAAAPSQGAPAAAHRAAAGQRVHANSGLAPAHRPSVNTGLRPVSSDPGPAPGHHGTSPTSPRVSCASGCAVATGPAATVHHILSGVTSGASAGVSGAVGTVKKILPTGSGSSVRGSVGGVVTTTRSVVGGATGGLP